MVVGAESGAGPGSVARIVGGTTKSDAHWASRLARDMGQPSAL